MKFKDKSPGLQGVLNKFAMLTFGRTTTEAFEKQICVDCGQDASKLTGIDLDEYEISGLCPECFKLDGTGHEKV